MDSMIVEKYKPTSRLQQYRDALKAHIKGLIICMLTSSRSALCCVFLENCCEPISGIRFSVAPHPVEKHLLLALNWFSVEIHIGFMVSENFRAVESLMRAIRHSWSNWNGDVFKKKRWLLYDLKGI